MLASYATFIGYVQKLLSTLGGVAIVVTMLLIVVDVITRYFGLHIPAVYEIVVNYFMPAITFLPLMQVEREEQMISVEIMSSLGGDTFQGYLLRFATFMALLVYLALTYTTMSEALRQMKVSSYLIVMDIRLPIWAAHFFLPLAFGAAVLVVAYRLVNGPRATGRPLPQGE